MEKETPKEKQKVEEFMDEVIKVCEKYKDDVPLVVCIARQKGDERVGQILQGIPSEMIMQMELTKLGLLSNTSKQAT